MKRVVVALIQDEQEGSKRCFLIASRKDFGEWTGAFYPPGGHVEEGESDEETLRRELREELDVELKTAALLTESAGDVKDQITAWYACTVDGEPQPNMEELGAAGFFTAEEIKSLRLWPATEAFLKEFFLPV